jgi:hypothetical protein
MKMEIRDKAFIRLHKGYRLPIAANPKILNQYIKSFSVIRRVGRLIYKLNIPERWKIHPVIFITQLKPASKDQDPFNRPFPELLEIAENIPGDTDE